MTRGAHVCRTPEDAFRAGWEAAEDAPPLTPTQIDRLVLLHRPYLVPEDPAAERSTGVMPLCGSG